MRSKRPAPPAATSELRIIGGDWRSRKLRFPAVEGLRPTPDRVRETLFNWLSPHIEGARALDLFAGSGALGLEALSRGARHVTFTELSPAAASALSANIALLTATQRTTLLRQDALAMLDTPPTEAFDVVFLDPPFRQQWLDRILPKLAQPGWLAPQAWVYVEQGRDESVLVPPGWHPHRTKEAGQVRYTLFRVDTQADAGVSA